MGAPTKRAKIIRSADEFDISRLSAQLMQPRDGRTTVFSWSLAEIFRARDLQMIGDFFRPARMAESMCTDDALQVAKRNRLAPQRCIKVGIKPASGARAKLVAGEAEALFGENGVGVHSNAVSDIHRCLVDHGVAFGINVATPREDGTRIDFQHKAWPIEYVRWDPVMRLFKTRVDPSTLPPNEVPAADLANGVYGLMGGSEVPIIHGDGRWVIYQDHELDPFKQESACILSASLVWARHAFGNSDWMKGSKAHGNAKLVGEMPIGVPLQKEGKLTDEAAAFLELLIALMNSDSPIGIRPSGSETEFVSNNSTAWQIFDKLVSNAERSAARIYLGTDGMLGAQGGAPGVDVQALMGVAFTLVQGDLRCIQDGMNTGVIEPWTAMNFGDSSLAPKRQYLLADTDEDAEYASTSQRRTAFYDEIDRARKSGFQVTTDFVAEVAKRHGFDDPPELAPAPVPTMTPAA